MPGAGRDEERGGDPALADPSPEPHAFPAALRDDDEDSDDALVRPSSPRDVGMSPPVATLNLASAICGAGIMALPNAFRVLGLAGGALALLLMHAVTHTTVGFLTRGTRDSGATTYAALVGHHLGPAWRRAVQIAIVLNNFGVMVVYQIIFGDVLAGSRADLRAVPIDPDAPVDPDPDRGDYDNITEPTPPPPSPPPPSHHARHHHHPSPHAGGGASGDPRGRLRALVPWALERAGGTCRVSVQTRGDGYGGGGGGDGGGDGGVSFEFGGYPDHGILSSPRLTGAAYRPAREYDSRSEYDSRWFALSSFANHRRHGHDGDHGGGGGGGAPAPPPTILRSEWFCSRGFCVFATLAAFVVPLCLCRSLRSLGWASFASVGICVGIIVVAFGEYLAGDSSANASVDGSSASPSSTSSSSRSLRLWPDFENTDPRELLAVFSVVTTAYVCHFCVHPLYADLRDATPESFARVSSRALTIVTGMYLGISFAALALFGDGVHADVLLDFARDAAVDQIGVKASYVAQLALTYPVLFCVMREVLLELFRGDDANDKGERSVETTGATERGSPEGRLGGGGGGDDDDLERRLLDEEEETRDGAPSATPSASRSSAYDRVDRWTHVAVTLGLIGAQFFVAMSTPDIDVALAFLGSTLSVFVAFVAPAAVALSGGERGWTRWKAWGVLVMGACVAVAGLTAATWNVISPPR